MRFSRQSGHLALAAVALACVTVFYILTFRSSHPWGDDFALYIQHAKNIVNGDAYSSTGYIYNRDAAEVGPPTYPPVYPLILAPVYHWVGLNLRAMQIESLVLLVLLLASMFVWFRAWASFELVALLVLVFGFNYSIAAYKDLIASEVPFCLLVYWSLYGLDRALALPRERRSLLLAALAGIGAALSYGTRTIGVVVLPAMVLYCLIRERRISAFAIVLACVGAVGMGTQVALFHNPGGYADQIRISASLLKENISTNLYFAAGLWSAGGVSWLRNLTFMVVSALAGVGLWVRIRNGWSSFELFGLLYCVPLLLWPNTPSRYLTPIVPLYLAYAMLGFQRLFAWTPRPWLRPAVSTAVLLLIAGCYSLQHIRLQKLTRENVLAPQAQALFEFVRTETDPAASFLFAKPRALALFTGRKASAPAPEAGATKFWDYVRQGSFDFLIIAERSAGSPGETQIYLDELVRLMPGCCQLQYQSSQFRLYRINQGKTQSSPSG